MNTKSILNFLKGTAFKHVHVPLGRWSRHNYQKTALKIKYATQDNCAYSHSTNHSVQSFQSFDETSDNIDDNIMYMMGYESVH